LHALRSAKGHYTMSQKARSPPAANMRASSCSTGATRVDQTRPAAASTLRPCRVSTTGGRPGHRAVRGSAEWCAARPSPSGRPPSGAEIALAAPHRAMCFFRLGLQPDGVETTTESDRRSKARRRCRRPVASTISSFPRQQLPQAPPAPCGENLSWP